MRALVFLLLSYDFKNVAFISFKLHDSKSAEIIIDTESHVEAKMAF